MTSLLQFTRAFSKVLAGPRQYATLAELPKITSKLERRNHNLTRERPDEILIFVDASVKDGQAGAGVYSDGVCKIREPLQLAYGLKSGQAESQALLYGIRRGTLLASQHGRRYVTVCSDCEEALRVGRGYVSERKLENVRLVKVKGHSGLPGNAEAHRLAKSGRVLGLGMASGLLGGF